MNRAWVRRRTKRGLAARQFAACNRQLRRLQTAKAPLPHVAVSRGVGVTLTISVGLPEPRDTYWDAQHEDDW